MQRIPFKTYLNPLQCYIISLQQRYTRLFICLYSFIYLLIQRYSSICDNCLSKKSEFRWMPRQTLCSKRCTYSFLGIAKLCTFKGFFYLYFFPCLNCLDQSIATKKVNVKALILLLHWSWLRTWGSWEPGRLHLLRTSQILTQRLWTFGGLVKWGLRTWWDTIPY